MTPMLAGAVPPAPTVIVYVPLRDWVVAVFTCPPPPPPAEPPPPPPTSKMSAVTDFGNVIVEVPTEVNVYTAYTSVDVA